MSPKPSLAAFYRRPAVLIRRVHQVAIALFDEECGEFGVTNTQHGLLQAIRVTPDMDLIGAARSVGIDRTTANVAITNLERRGWIARAVNPNDRRSHALVITPAGMRLLRDSKPAINRAQRRLLQGLTPDEIRAFVGIMERIAPPLPLTNGLPKEMPSARRPRISGGRGAHAR